MINKLRVVGLLVVLLSFAGLPAAAQMAEGTKRFLNESGKDITLTLFIRDGDSPADEGEAESYDLPVNSEIEVVYEGYPGSEGYVFLNGLLIEWREGGEMTGVSRRVVQRGDAWDNLLNTDRIITIQSVGAGELTAAGSN